MDIVANYQQLDDARKVLWIDAENTLDAVWATKIGVDVSAMIILKPTSQSAEELFQFILDMIDSGEIGLVVLDSLGVLVSAQALEKTIEDKTYAGISMALTTFGNKAEMLCQRHQCTFIGINQIRDDLNAMWGGAIKTPGGRAWKHLCCVRMQFTRGDFIDERGNSIKRSSESPAGNVVLMSMTKNKSCPPNRRTGFYTITYDNGIDYLKDLIDLALRYGYITKRGAWFDVVDADTGEIIEGSIQGQANVYEYLSNPDNESVLTLIESGIEDKMNMD